jgi:glycine/D-amino acid oxidase-like deaminating enzyme
MLVFPRCRGWTNVPASVPQRRRIIVVGATEAGVAATFHLGAQAMLIEQRGIGDATSEAWDELWRMLPELTEAETRLGVRLTSVHVSERRLEISTGESFVYDKLVSTLPMDAFKRLIAGEAPARLNSAESWRHWLNARDVELLDELTQRMRGDLDGQDAGRRIAESIQVAMTMKYSTRAAFRNRSAGLFRPKIVASNSFPPPLLPPTPSASAN